MKFKSCLYPTSARWFFLLRLTKKIPTRFGLPACFAESGIERKNGGTERSFLHQIHTRTRYPIGEV